MTMKKRITSFALVLLMVLSSLAVLLPVTGVKAAAAGESATTPTTKTYKKVTTAPADWSGTYIIVYENGAEGYASNGTKSGYTAVSITDGKATAKNTTETLVDFEISKMANEGEYSIQVNGGENNGKYIGRISGTKGGDIFFFDSKTANKLSMDGSNVKIECSGPDRTYVLRFNSNSNSNCFRYYLSGQQAIQLYKLEEASEHVHAYNDTWSYDNQYHWHQCIKDSKCTVVDSKAAHTPDTTVSAYPKDTDTANHYFKCATCGEEYSVAHSSDTYLPTQDKSQHYQVCDVCKAEFNKGAHNWETDTEATNVPDGKLAQKCSVCGEKRIIATPKEVTIDFTAQGYKDKQAIEKYESDKFLLTFAKGSGSNAPIYYIKGTAIRMYSNNTLTIKGVNGEKIAKIEFTFASGEDSNEIDVNSGAFIKNTWTGSANEVTFTIKGSSGHRRIKLLAITYEAPAPEPEAPKFEYATLDVKENIDVNFYVSVPNGYDVANLKTFFNFHRADTSVVGEPVNTENGLLYRFTLKDVAPHLMGENITATLKNGDTVIATLDYSINTYLDNQKKDTTLSDSTKALIESIAAYGDKAADYNNKISDSTTFTGTATADPADMTESKPTIGTTLEGFRFKGVAVRMENNIRIRVSFENTSGAELKFFVKVGDGKETEAILSNGYVYTDLIAPSAYDTEYTIIAKNAGGETVGTVSLSVNTYVCMVLKAFPADGTFTNAQAAMRELAIAIYNYGKAAKTAIGA